MQRWAADQESAMWEGAPDRPTSACYTVARRGEATRRRVAAVAAPWNGLDGYAAAGLGPPAMDGWTNGSLVSYKESWEKK